MLGSQLWKGKGGPSEKAIGVRTATMVAEHRGNMQVFVRAGQTHTLQLSSESTAQDVKHMIAAREGFPATEQRIVFAGQELAEDECLSQAGVRDEATLQVLGRLLGGAKKRKKKTYTKPKKIKHKHKKIKLRILKFYKVDDSGKVSRLRRTCPSESCGPGIFMATHFDRVYCGKCGLTYMYDKGEKA